MKNIMVVLSGIMIIGLLWGSAAVAQSRVFTNKDLRRNGNGGSSAVASVLEIKASPISIDFKDAEAYQVLHVIADVARGADGVELVISPEISGKLTLTLSNTPWTTIVKTIMKQQNLSAVSIDKKTLLIYPKKQAEPVK